MPLHDTQTERYVTALRTVARELYQENRTRLLVDDQGEKWITEQLNAARLWQIIENLLTHRTPASITSPAYLNALRVIAHELNRRNFVDLTGYNRRLAQVDNAQDEQGLWALINEFCS